jgi:hypothetical protein
MTDSLENLYVETGDAAVSWPRNFLCSHEAMLATPHTYLSCGAVFYPSHRSRHSSCRRLHMLSFARNLPPITYDRLSPLPPRLVVRSTSALAVVGFMNCFCRRYFDRLLSDYPDFSDTFILTIRLFKGRLVVRSFMETSYICRLMTECRTLPFIHPFFSFGRNVINGTWSQTLSDQQNLV